MIFHQLVFEENRANSYFEGLFYLFIFFSLVVWLVASYEGHELGVSIIIL